MKTKRRAGPLLSVMIFFSMAGWLAADDAVDLVQAQREIPEDLLLDVGILVFDPGLPEDEYERFTMEEKGIFADVRKSEARYIPMRIKRTLESSGYWGAVRIVPESNVVDLDVQGTILESNGKKLVIEIVATDATGRRWMKKKYDAEADPLAYADTKTQREPFQNLYNEIANDLLDKREDRDPEDLREIRRVSELKFAADLAPAPFADYLEEKKGRYEAVKLPAREDPLMAHVSEIRARDYLFIDTLNEYYADLYDKMEGPYQDWRSYSYEEQVALDKLNKQARWEKIAGAAAIIGGIIASNGRSRAGRTAGQIGVLGGMAAVMDGMNKSEEAKMHREGLKELAQSLDADVSGLLLEVEGEILRLSGSVETQYAKWREILKRMYATELGLPVDPNASTIAAPQETSPR